MLMNLSNLNLFLNYMFRQVWTENDHLIEFQLIEIVFSYTTVFYIQSLICKGLSFKGQVLNSEKQSFIFKDISQDWLGTTVRKIRLYENSKPVVSTLRPIEIEIENVLRVETNFWKPSRLSITSRLTLFWRRDRDLDQDLDKNRDFRA